MNRCGLWVDWPRRHVSLHVGPLTATVLLRLRWRTVWPMRGCERVGGTWVLRFGPLVCTLSRPLPPSGGWRPRR